MQSICCSANYQKLNHTSALLHIIEIIPVPFFSSFFVHFHLRYSFCWVCFVSVNINNFRSSRNELNSLSFSGISKNDFDSEQYPMWFLLFQWWIWLPIKLNFTITVHFLYTISVSILLVSYNYRLTGSQFFLLLRIVYTYLQFIGGKSLFLFLFLQPWAKKMNRFIWCHDS